MVKKNIKNCNEKEALAGFLFVSQKQNNFSVKNTNTIK